MQAVTITGIGPVGEGQTPVELRELSAPRPGPGEVRIAITYCGVCHTELDEIEGRTPPPALPVVPGHEVVGVIDETGSGVAERKRGERVGVGWIHSSCGTCRYCRSGRENLCSEFRATGRDADGGYAEYLTVPEGFCYPIPEAFSDAEAAPLLCAGGVGYRALRLANIADGMPLGFTGFGASAHLVLQLARLRYPSSPLYVFTRRETKQASARALGADWAGRNTDTPPQPAAAIIDTTPAWHPVIMALRSLAPGGRLVINAIRKESADQAALQQLSYERDLWMEKEIKSVANVTAADISAFLEEAAAGPITPQVTVYPLSRAAEALEDLKKGRGEGAKVLSIRGT
jgi:propanol-preferring alcohol dehydrogenase